MRPPGLLPLSRLWPLPALARGQGKQEEVAEFAAALSDSTLPPALPARLLDERFQRTTWRARRRSATEDWTILVRALNLHLEKRTAAKLQMSTVWPRVGELEQDYNRRCNAAAQARRAHFQRAESDALERS